MAVTRDDVSKAINAMGLSNKPICVHSSLREFGWVEDGAEGIVNSFLEHGCTILAPTFSWMFADIPPMDLRPSRNGCGDYSWLETETKDENIPAHIYNPQRDDIDKVDMGAIPEAIIKMKDRKRGNHPLNSFSAIGPLAEELVSKQHSTNVYAPLRTLTELNGEVILMGVGLEKLTALHLAEQMAGRNLFRRWSKDSTGSPIMVEVGGCSDGFNQFETFLSPIERKVTVGNSNWRVFTLYKLLNVAQEAIKHNPLITHCGNSGCDRCNDAVLGGPIL
jgi:aminoglycoside N3'-acetyltransferase